MKKLLITTAFATMTMSVPALAEIGCEEGDSMYTVTATTSHPDCLRSPHAAPPVMMSGLGFGPYAYVPERRRVLEEHPRARFYAYEPGLTRVDEGVSGGND